jgi:hypothetical protein
LVKLSERGVEWGEAAVAGDPTRCRSGLRLPAMLGRVGVMAVAVMTVTTVACGQGEGDDAADVEAGPPVGFAATPEYVEDAIGDLDEVPHRFEMSASIGVETGGGSADIGSTLHGEFDGERLGLASEPTSALGFGSEGEEILDRVGEVLYVRVANAEEMLEVMPDVGAQRDLLEVLATSGDRWGRVDLRAIEDVLPDDFVDQAADLRVQGLSPGSFARLVTDAESVEEAGTKEIRGETMTGLAAMVSAGDISRAQTGGSAAPSTTTSAVDEPEPGSIADVMADLRYQVEVWFDHEGNIRRLVLDQTEAYDDLFERIGDEPGETPPSFTSVITLDLFDYGDDIDVDIPDSGDTVDVTEEFARQYQ